MRGHEDILKLRRKGFRPAYVWLQDTGLAPTDHAVTLDKSDIPEALDLRFLVGTTVLVEASERERFSRILAACAESKPNRIIGTLFQATDGFDEVIETTDTEGVLTWQK